MFGNAPAVQPVSEVTPRDELIPLSHFELDHPQPPEGWSNFLGRRGITLRPDHIGRDAISGHDAQVLLHEQRANEIRVAKLRQLQEQLAVEADQLRRAQIWQGIPADHLPVGASPASVMLAATKDAQPKRQSVLQHALSNTEEMVFHPIRDEGDAS